MQLLFLFILHSYEWVLCLLIILLLVISYLLINVSGDLHRCLSLSPSFPSPLLIRCQQPWYHLHIHHSLCWSCVYHHLESCPCFALRSFSLTLFSEPLFVLSLWSLTPCRWSSRDRIRICTVSDWRSNQRSTCQQSRLMWTGMLRCCTIGLLQGGQYRRQPYPTSKEYCSQNRWQTLQE